MRVLALLASLGTALLTLTACGGGDNERTVVINPSPGQTVVVPYNGPVRQCPAGATAC
jgi:hypothetical protein